MSLTESHLTDEQLLESLSFLQRDFFDAISEDPEAADSFARRFAQLGEMTVKRTQSLSQADAGSILGPALAAAMTISAVASSLHDVTRFADELSVELQTDLVGLFDNLSLNSVAKPKDNSESPFASLPDTEPKGSSRHALPLERGPEREKYLTYPEPDVTPLPHQTRVYRWLRKNLHNPYPNVETKRRIAEKSSVALKVVSDWFSQARRRIGWNTVLKGHFQGNRQLCVDYAHRVFVDGSGPSTYDDEILKDFLNMKLKLEQLQDRSGSNSIAKQWADSGSVPTTCVDITTTKKRRRVSNEDDAQQFERQEYSVASPHRPMKRMKESNPTVLYPLSRTASLSESVSSRSSTAELSTPISQTLPLPLPTLDFDDSIEKWVSSISTESAEDQYNNIQHAKKRFMSDYDSGGPAKRIRLSDPGSPWIVSEPQPHASTNENEALFSYEHFDFDLPPAASVDTNLFVGEPLHINSFDYAKWGIDNPDEGTLPEPDIEYLSVMKGDAVRTPSNIQGDMVKEFVDVTETIDIPNEQVEDYTHVVNLPASEGLISGTSMQEHNSIPGKERSFFPPPVNAVDGSLEWLMKLTRINYLLAEAAQLQSEVFS